MKDKLKQTWLSLFIIFLAIITWLIALPSLPNEIAMQYSSAGDVTWSTNKFIAFIFSIAVMLFCYFVMNNKTIFNNKNNNHFSGKKSFKKFLSPIVQLFIYIIFLIIIFNAFSVF